MIFCAMLLSCISTALVSFTLNRVNFKISNIVAIRVQMISNFAFSAVLIESMFLARRNVGFCLYEATKALVLIFGFP